MREGTPGCTDLGGRAWIALGDESERTGPARGRGRPAGRSGRPPPARRAGPSRPAGPAGAARGRHWACSDGGQVAPRASFRAARTRDLPGRPAPPDAAGTDRRDPSGLGAGRGAAGGRGRAGRRPTPTRPRARGERAGGLADAAARESRRLVPGGEGAPWPRSPGGAREGGSRPGRVGLGPGRDAAAAARRGRALRPGHGRTRPVEQERLAIREAPAPPRPPAPDAEGAHSPRREPAKRGGQTFSAPGANPPLGFQRWHFLGLARTPAPINPPRSAGDME